MIPSNVISYTRDPDDEKGFLFHREDAEPVYLWGPEAEGMAARLDASKPPMLAQNAPLAAPEDWSRHAINPGEEVRYDVPPQLAAPPTQTAAPSTPAEAAYEGIAQRAEERAAAKTGNLQEALGPSQPAGGAPVAQLSVPAKITIPGTPATKGGFQPRERKVEGAIPADPELMKAQEQLFLEDVATHQAIAREQEARAHEAELQAVVARPFLEERAADAQKRYDVMMAQWKKDSDVFEQLIMDQRARKTDPNRWFKNKSVPSQISTVIGQALGMFATNMAAAQGINMPNYAQQLVDKAIDRDISAQEWDIRKGQADVGNQLYLLREKGLTLEQAKEALRVAMLDSAAMQREEWMQGEKRKEVLEQYALWELEAKKSMLAALGKARAESIGKVTTTEKYAVATGGAPTRIFDVNALLRGEYVGQPGAEKAEKALAGHAERTFQITHGGAKPKEQGQLPEGAPGAAQTHRLYVTERNKFQNLKDQIDSLSSRFDTDLKTYGDVPGIGWTGNLPGQEISRGAWAALGSERAKEGQSNRIALQSVVNNILYTMSGKQINEAEAARIMKQIQGSGTEGEVIQGLQQMSRYIHNNIENLAGLGAEQAPQYEQNIQGERAREVSKEKPAGASGIEED